MSNLGDFPEDWLSRLLRYFGYFLFGALLGLIPAAFLVAATSAPHIAWRIPIIIVVGSGVVFCLLGILTRGSFLGWLLRLFGKDIDRGSWP
jgi:hypothetical protein